MVSAAHTIKRVNNHYALKIILQASQLNVEMVWFKMVNFVMMATKETMMDVIISAKLKMAGIVMINLPALVIEFTILFVEMDY